MRTGKVAFIGLVLAGAVSVAVASVVAETRSEQQAQEQLERARQEAVRAQADVARAQAEIVRAQQEVERTRPRVMMLDGRGARLGVSVQDLDEQALKAAGGIQSGVRIDEVDAESPASKAGIREGDVVVEVDGERVRSARQFARLIQETPDGRSVKLGVMRDGKRQTIDVTPESRGLGMAGGLIGREIERSLRDIEPRLREIEPRLRELEPRLRELEPRLREFRFNVPFELDLPRITSPRGRLGVQVNELSPQLAEYFGVKEGGVLVAGVTKDSPAERAGLKAGDVITSIDGDRVRDTEDLVDELRGKDGQIAVGIVRERKQSSVTATLEDEAPRRTIRRPA